MLNAFRSEWLLLNRFRLWLIAGLTTVAFTATATAIVVASSEPAGQSSGGISLEALAGPGGATAGVIWSLAFGSVLMLAAFTSNVGNEFTRGTFRSSLLYQPGRLSLVTGKLAARMTVAGVLMAAALVTGAATSAIVASSGGISTTGWFGLEALGEAGVDYGRLMAWTLGWALVGTTVAVIVRSTPIALGMVILWFGPIENVIGEDLELARRWFPGQLLQAIVSPGSPDVVSTATAAPTLAVYGVVCVAILTTVLVRRDVTS